MQKKTTTEKAPEDMGRTEIIMALRKYVRGGWYHDLLEQDTYFLRDMLVYYQIVGGNRGEPLKNKMLFGKHGRI